MTEEASCSLTWFSWRREGIVLMASSFSLTNVSVSLSADSSRTAPVMYGAALVLPQLLLQGHDKAEKKRETEMQMQVSFFRSFKIFSVTSLITISDLGLPWLQGNMINLTFCLVWCSHLMCVSVISWVHLHGVPDHSRGHQGPHPQRNQAGQGCHAVWHKVSLFYRSRSDADHSFWTRACILCTIWTTPMPNIKQEKPYFGCILLSTIKMFTVICEQWHNVY